MAAAPVRRSRCARRTCVAPPACRRLARRMQEVPACTRLPANHAARAPTRLFTIAHGCDKVLLMSTGGWRKAAGARLAAARSWAATHEARCGVANLPFGRCKMQCHHTNKCQRRQCTTNRGVQQYLLSAYLKVWFSGARTDWQATHTNSSSPTIIRTYSAKFTVKCARQHSFYDVHTFMSEHKDEATCHCSGPCCAPRSV